MILMIVFSIIPSIQSKDPHIPEINHVRPRFAWHIITSFFFLVTSGTLRFGPFALIVGKSMPHVDSNMSGIQHLGAKMKQKTICKLKRKSTLTCGKVNFHINA